MPMSGIAVETMTERPGSFSLGLSGVTSGSGTVRASGWLTPCMGGCGSAFFCLRPDWPDVMDAIEASVKRQINAAKIGFRLRRIGVSPRNLSGLLWNPPRVDKDATDLTNRIRRGPAC